ncbi:MULTISPECIES: hypothetical protein [Moorena]|uniref:hypothetical protein n=1 Tax=Moorena TaxID=1155738 RepID=UPI000319F59A|nr:MULTISPECIES: hypothetical protein [Moorena]NEP37330.1 hypothetical protein [Moorena sp. SIO3B2]NEP63973.1 hypothetical protein [Moorena sp. SIO3A5]
MAAWSRCTINLGLLATLRERSSYAMLLGQKATLREGRRSAKAFADRIVICDRIPDSQLPIPDSRFPIPDSRFPIPEN